MAGDIEKWIEEKRAGGWSEDQIARALGEVTIELAREKAVAVAERLNELARQRLFAPYGVIPEAFDAGRQAPRRGRHPLVRPSEDLARQGVAPLVADGVPPQEDGFYYLHQQGRSWRIDAKGNLETLAAWKLRRFLERGFGADVLRFRRSGWLRRQQKFET